MKTPVSLTLEVLAPKVNPSLGPYVMECSGNGAFAAFGMLSAARWSGVPIADVLAMIDVLPQATRVLVSGLRQLLAAAAGHLDAGSELDLHGRGAREGRRVPRDRDERVPLALDHGFPIRLMVPNWYGCTCIKWVDAITLVDDGAPATSQMQEFASGTHPRALARGSPRASAWCPPAKATSLTDGTDGRR